MPDWNWNITYCKIYSSGYLIVACTAFIKYISSMFSYHVDIYIKQNRNKKCMGDILQCN